VNNYEYRWSSPEDLRARDLHWVMRACRERGISTWQQSRAVLLAKLREWEKNQ